MAQDFYLLNSIDRTIKNIDRSVTRAISISINQHTQLMGSIGGITTGIKDAIKSGNVEVLEAINKINDIKKEVEQEAESERESKVSKQVSDLIGVLFAFKITADRLHSAFSDAIRLNNNLLSVGVEPATAVRGNSVTLSREADNIISSFGRMELVLAATESGLGKLGEGTSNLLLSQKLLGADHRATAKALGTATAGTGMNSEQISVLSTNLVSFSNRFGVKVDTLLGALSNLNNAIVLGLVRGTSGRMLSDMAALAGAVGPVMGAQITKAMDEFLGQEGFIKAGLLGVSNQRQAAMDTGNVTPLFLSAAREARSRLGNITSGAGDPSIGIDIFTKLYGQNSLIMIKALEDLERRAEAQGLSADEYIRMSASENEKAELRAQALEKIKEAFLQPLKSMGLFLTNFMNFISNNPFLIKIVTVLGHVFAILSTVVAALAAHKLILSATQSFIPRIKDDTASIAISTRSAAASSASASAAKAAGAAGAARGVGATVAARGAGAAAGVGIRGMLSAIPGWGMALIGILSVIDLIGTFMYSSKKSESSLNAIERNTDKIPSNASQNMEDLFTRSMKISLDFASLNYNNNSRQVVGELEKLNNHTQNANESRDKLLYSSMREPQSRFNRGPR